MADIIIIIVIIGGWFGVAVTALVISMLHRAR